MREQPTVVAKRAGNRIPKHVVTWFFAFIGMFMGVYTYEKLGGADGIDATLSNAYDALLEVFAAHP